MQKSILVSKKLISILLSFALLSNMAVPAYSQVHKPSSPIQNAVIRQLPIQDTVVTQIDQNAFMEGLNDSIKQIKKGSLTNAQVSQIQEIESIFSPTDPNQPSQSDFDFFQETYLKQIDQEFQREANALEDSRREVQHQIDTEEQGYQSEICTFILPKNAERILEENAPREISHKLLEELKSISFDPKQTLSDQLSTLTNKYQPNSQEAILLEQISREVQQAASIRQQAIAAWKNQAQAQLQDWYTSNTHSLEKWKKEAVQNMKSFYETVYEPQVLQERENIVRNSVKTLWDYKDLGELASDTLLDVAPIIAPMSTLDGKSFFSKKQKEWLINQYLNTLRNNQNCGEKFPDTPTCDSAWRAIGGLSLLTDSRDVAWAIEEFMSAKRDTNQAVPSLLLGTAALLSMKQYSVLRGFLYRATQDENSMDNVDWLSVENLVNAQANRDGQYLGQVSKYGQYPLYEKATDKTALGNAWEDIAQILADEGSPEALNLLREFGVEKCSVRVEKTVSLKDQTILSCGGIIPFLTGALISGKSGAEQYNPTWPRMQAGQTVTATGGSEYVSPETAQQNQSLAKQRVQLLRTFAAEKGLTVAGALIRHLFMQSMGDLNAESELRLDTRLYEAFQAEKQTPKPDFTLTPYTRNSMQYNAKRLRQDRTQVFRKAGRIADLVILVWCLVDLTKWSVSGVKIAGAFSHMARMARGGATVAQRAAYLHRLKIAPKAIKMAKLPARAKSSAAAIVLPQLPQFTNQTVKLPALPGALKSVGTLTAENLALSAETGNLLVNYQGLRASGMSATQVFDIKKAVEGAVQATNTTFANSTRFTLNEKASYNRLLSKNLLESLAPYRFSAANRATVVGHVASMPTSIPADIPSFKTPRLFDVLSGTNIRGTAPALNRTTLAGLMTRSLGETPTTAQLDHSAQLINSALYNANIQYARNPWWLRSNKQYKKIFLNNLTASFDKDGKVFKQGAYRNFYQTLMAAVKGDRSLTAPSKISSWRKMAQPNASSQFVSLGKAVLNTSGATQTVLPLTVQADPSLKAAHKTLYQRVTFTPQPNSAFVELGLDGKKIPLVKIQLDNAQVPDLLQAAARSGSPLKLKVSASQPFSFSSFWENFKLTHRVDKKRYFFRGRGELFPHEIPLFVRQADGTLQGTQISLLADSHLGWRQTTAVLDGQKLSLYKNGKLLQPSKLSFGLPKTQLSPFLNVLRSAQPEKPFTLTLTPGKNKIRPLMWANGLSLSAASSGLIVPLENTYGDQITEGDKIAISLALPYIPALLSPVISPFVMRFGALNVLKTSMVFSLAGLGFAGLAGFRGYAAQRSPLPPLWPLFVSGTAIGISSSLSRASLNLLIDGMGGGGQLLKSMLAKNVGSVALLLPPFVANFIDKDIDFSLAFPTMSILSLSMLAWLSATRIDPGIGRKANFRLFKDHGLLKESRSAVRLLVTKEVGPLVLATTAFTGFEAAAFYKAGNQLLSPTMRQTGLVQSMPKSNRNNATALLTAMAIQALPLLARATAKPLTNALKSPAIAGQEYRRILKMSYALNITGGSLLFANGLQGDNAKFGLLGLAMMGLGTANVTQSLQKLSNLRALDSQYVLRHTVGLVGQARQLEKQAMVTKTMTGFSSSQVGLAVVPWFVGRYTDRQISEGVEVKSQAARDSMWIPLISIGLSAGLAGPAIGLLPKRIPLGLPFLTKGVFGSYPAAVKQLATPSFYLKKPYYGVPPGFLPLSTDPIINMDDLVPSRKVMEKAEKQLKEPATAKGASTEQ